jgi:predicted  nucleic acid-binding Zn-ribbon protein
MSMSTMRAKLAEMLEKLEQERDELKVRMHLGKAEAREEWEKMEERIGELRGRLDKAGDEAVDVMEDVGAAAKLLGEEIREGFARLRKTL